MSSMSIFEGASQITVNGNVTNNNTSGDYTNKSRHNITNNYGAQTVSQTNYVNSNNDYSSHHHQKNYGSRTTVNHINSNNTTQTSYVNSNNDNSNTMYGGDWRDYPQYPQRGPPQGLPPQGPEQSHWSHPGMTQGDPQAGGQVDPNQRWGPDYPEDYQQQYYPSPGPSKRSRRRARDHALSHLGVEHYQQYSSSEAEFRQQPHLEHVLQRPASFHAALAPNSSRYTADLQQQYYSEQIVAPQTRYPAQEDGAESSEPASTKVSKKGKPEDKDRKGKNPLRARVETVTDDEDDHLPVKSKDDERAINETLRPVLEKLSDTDTDDDFGDLLMAPPPRNIRPASVPAAQVQSTSTATATSTATSTQGNAAQRPNTTAQVAATAQSAGRRPAVVASASAPPVSNSSVAPNPLASTSANAPAPVAHTSNSGSRVSSRRPTDEEVQEALESINISRLSSTLSSSDESSDKKKKKKKGVLSRMFGKKKDKGGVVDINIG